MRSSFSELKGSMNTGGSRGEEGRIGIAEEAGVKEEAKAAAAVVIIIIGLVVG